MKIRAFVKRPLGWFWHLSLFKKVVVLAIVGIIVWFASPKIIGTQRTTPQYQTAVVERGTLIESVTVSGLVSGGNSAAVNSQASGVVAEVYVENGDAIEAGKPIAKITLDQISLQKQQAAWSSYSSAQNTLKAAQAKMNSLQSSLFQANQTFMNGAGIKDPVKDNPTYVEQNADWLQAEADYKNQAGVIAQAQTALSSAWLSYQQLSDTVVAPIAGTVEGVTLQVGTVLAGNSTSSTTTSQTSSTSTSSQKIATIKTAAAPTIVVNLTEIDVTKVKIGNKATLTFDAYPDKTYTGKVVSIDTSGNVSSGVTTYPTTIMLDTHALTILPNMSVTASIITNTKDDVLLVPSSAIVTQNNQSIVRTIKNGKVEQIPVVVGAANDTQTEIVSGLSEGDTIVTSVQATRQGSGSTASPFSGLRGGFGGGTRISR